MTAHLEKYQRNAEIAALLASGSTTLKEIGKAYGITRERVRQIAASRGVTQRTTNGSDPLAVLRAIRTSRCMSFTAVKKVTGLSLVTVRKTVAALEMTDAVRRLFRWRKAAQWRARERRVLHAYRVESARLGRPLVAREALRLSPSPVCIYGKNYISRLRAAVGEPVNKRVSRLGRRGDLRATILALAASKQGCTVPAVLGRIPTTRESVAVTIALLCQEGLIYNADGKRGRYGHSTYRAASERSR